MREDPVGSALGKRNREPRHVIAISYGVASVYITSKVGIANVPGDVMEGMLLSAAVVSHSLNPNEGRTTLGSFSFEVVDKDGDVTTAIVDQLFDEDDGIRHATVRYWTGDTDDFDDDTWTLVLTQRIDNVYEYDQGAYRFQCSDRLRELRETIFDSPKTRITSSLETTDSVINVVSTADFTMMAHSSAYTDAPSETAGYLIIPKTNEIIRYADKTATQFVGCTREVGNTIATRVEIAAGTEDDRLPEIREFPYYEGSVVDLAYGFITGEFLDGRTLPTVDNAGVSTSDVVKASFENIGTDLYDPANPDAGLVLRFIHLDKTDAKRFVEEQLLWVAGCFLGITTEGKLKLCRLPRILSDAVPSAVITEADVISHSPLRHELSELVNQIRIDWNWDGDGNTRTSTLTNAGSISIHGEGETYTRELRGLTVQRHTAQTVRRIFEWLTDLYGAPPLTKDVQVSSRFNDVEVGDVVRLTMPSVRDSSSPGGTLDRSFLVVGVDMDWVTGDLTLKLFGSSAEVLPDQPEVDTTPLSEEWYVSEGTELSAALTIVGGVVTSSGTLTGADDVNDPDAIYYYEGDLTINADVQVNVTQNVQLRIRGTLTVNGTIDGVGRGLDPVADPNTVGLAHVFPSGWDQPTVGATRGGGGVWYVNGGNFYSGIGQPVTLQGNLALPRAVLSVENGALLGIPSEVRGTPGQYGGPVISSDTIVRGLGGDGGRGGAGLTIICRGLVFGVNGAIDLSGETGATGQAGDVSHGGNTLRPGTGGGGAAGGLYVFLDDTGAVLPDLAGHFVADHGGTVVSGNTIGIIPPDAAPASPWTGLPGIGAQDTWKSSSVVQWVPMEEQLGEGAQEVVPAPVFVSATGSDYGVEIKLAALPESEYDIIQLFASITNDRGDAVRIAEIRAPHYTLTFDGIKTYYLWARAIKGSRKSDWSSAADDGFQATGGSLVAQIAGGWTDTFDGYLSEADVLREWERIAGNGPLAISDGGENGSKVLQVTGRAKLVMRRNVPLEPGRMYEVGIRYRLVTAETSQNLLTAGFYGTLQEYAGSLGFLTRTISGLGTRDMSAMPNATLGLAMDISAEPLGEWVVKRNYLFGSASSGYTVTALGTTPALDGAPGAPHYARGIRWDGLIETPCTGVRPALDINGPAGTTSVTEIDTMWILPMESADPFQARLLDGNFSADSGMRYWWWNPTTNPQISRSSGGGVAGGDGITFAVDGAATGVYVTARHGLATTANEKVVVHVTYKLHDITTISSSAQLAAQIRVLRRDPVAQSPSNYAQWANALVSKDIDELDDDGDFHVWGLEINVPPEFHESDGFELQVGYNSGASDDFKMTIGRVKVAQV